MLNMLCEGMKRTFAAIAIAVTLCGCAADEDFSTMTCAQYTELSKKTGVDAGFVWAQQYVRAMNKDLGVAARASGPSRSLGRTRPRRDAANSSHPAFDTPGFHCVALPTSTRLGLFMRDYSLLVVGRGVDFQRNI
jgi:hypothetical protein